MQASAVSTALRRLSAMRHAPSRGGVRWAAAVFRAQSPPPRRDRGRVLFLLAGAALAVAVLTVVQLQRQAGGRASRTLWAEDGTIYIGQYERHGFVGSLLRSYAGYEHLLPRLLAPLSAVVPVARWSLLMSGGAAFGVAILCVLVFRASAAYVSWIPGRVLLAVLPALLPVAALETLDNLTNLQWYLTWAAVWLLLWRPVRRWEQGLGSVVVFLAVTSGPLTIVLVPLALLRLRLPRAAERAPGIALLAGGCLQLGVMLTAHRAEFGRASWGDAARTGLVRVGLGSLDGVRDATWHWHRFGWLAVVAAIGLIVICLVVGLWQPYTRLLTVGAVALALVYFAVSERFALGQPPPAPLRGDARLLLGSRYSVLPQLLVLTVVILGSVVALARRRVLAVPLVVALLLPAGYAVVRDFAPHTFRSSGPTWPASVAAAERSCLRAPNDDRTVFVQESPDLPNWQVPVSCERLRSD